MHADGWVLFWLRIMLKLTAARGPRKYPHLRVFSKEFGWLILSFVLSLFINCSSAIRLHRRPWRKSAAKKLSSTALRCDTNLVLAVDIPGNF
jgi:hypothetical protein